MTSLPPLALYVHVPWCVRKCPYCDFNSHGVGREAGLPEASYLAALLADLDADLPLAAGRELVSIFIGGGTPSLMSAAFYQELLEGIAGRLPLAVDIEITLEHVRDGRYLGQAPDNLRYRWYLQLQPQVDEPEWRLVGEGRFPDEDAVHLTPGRAAPANDS